MKTVAAIYTGAALVDPLKNRFSSMYPQHRLINILDDSLISDVIEAGRITNEVMQRIYLYCREAAATGADLILQTCSSVGESVDLIQPFFPIPILRIDRPMAQIAIGEFRRIGVIATLPTTLGPTTALISRVAEEQKKTIVIEKGLADGAFQLLTNGDSKAHDQRILDTAKNLKDSCDVFVLAQGSMARMADELQQISGLPVLSSLPSGLDSLSPFLEE